MKKNISATNHNTNNSIKTLAKGLAYAKTISLSKEQISELPKEEQELVLAIQTVNAGGNYREFCLLENSSEPKLYIIRSKNIPLMLQKFPTAEKAKCVAEQLLPKGEFFDVIEDETNKTFRIVRDGNPVNETVYETRQDACLDLIAITNPELYAKAKAFAEN